MPEVEVLPDIVDDTKFKDFMGTVLNDKEVPKDDEPPMWRVTLHNDPTTLPGFVVAVLTSAFKIEGKRARGIMVTAHVSGQCLVLVDTKERVETMMSTASTMISGARPGKEFASWNGEPAICELRLSSEEESNGSKKK